MTRNFENGDAQFELAHSELKNTLRLQDNQENTENKARTERVQNENRQSEEPRRLAAGDWLRAVMGFSAPFGHDGMPTVWG